MVPLDAGRNSTPFAETNASGAHIQIFFRCPTIFVKIFHMPPAPLAQALALWRPATTPDPGVGKFRNVTCPHHPYPGLGNVTRRSFANPGVGHVTRPQDTPTPAWVMWLARIPQPTPPASMQHWGRAQGEYPSECAKYVYAYVHVYVYMYVYVYHMYISCPCACISVCAAYRFAYVYVYIIHVHIHSSCSMLQTHCQWFQDFASICIVIEGFK